MIRFQNVSFSYKESKIFEDLSFNLDDFSCASILGLNGEGKTTLIQLILGILKPDKGNIYIDDIDINTLNENKLSHLLSYVPQENDDSLSMSVIDFICMGSINRQNIFYGPSNQDKQSALSLLKQIGYEELADRDLLSLSAGQKRLMYLARSFFQDSKILVMDEPVSSLDYIKQYSFLNYLKDYLNKNNKKAILSIHDPILAYEFSDTFLFFKDHKLFDILQIKDNDSTKQFINDVTFLYDKKVEVISLNNKLYMNYLP